MLSQNCVISAGTSSEDFVTVFFIQVKHLVEVVVTGNDLQEKQSFHYNISGKMHLEVSPRYFNPCLNQNIPAP